MLQAIQADVMVADGSRARAADQAEVAEQGEPMWSQQCREDVRSRRDRGAAGVDEDGRGRPGMTPRAAPLTCRSSRRRGGPGWSMPAKSP